MRVLEGSMSTRGGWFPEGSERRVLSVAPYLVDLPYPGEIIFRMVNSNRVWLFCGFCGFERNLLGFCSLSNIRSIISSVLLSVVYRCDRLEEVVVGLRIAGANLPVIFGDTHP